MVKSIAVQLFLFGALLSLAFLFLKPTPAFAGGCTCQPPVSQVDANYACGSSTTDRFYCTANGNTASYGTIYCSDSQSNGGIGIRINEGNCSCTDNYNAQLICGEPSCKRQSEACSSDNDCCSGFKCNAKGVCATSCTGDESNANFCSDNDGTWKLFSYTKSDNVCISKSAFLGGWCKQDGCDGKGSYAACEYDPSDGSYGGTACFWAPNAQKDPPYTCYKCTCPTPPPPVTCTYMKSLVTAIGYATIDGNTTATQANDAQTQMNGGSNNPCRGTHVTYVTNASVILPLTVAGGSAPIQSICVKGDATPNLNTIILKDVTSNITIQPTAPDNTGYVYNFTSIKNTRPGTFTVVQATRAKDATYCEQGSQAIRFCSPTPPSQATNGFPNNSTPPNYINSGTPSPIAPPLLVNKSSDKISADNKLKWAHTVLDGSDKMLLLAISYRGNAGISIHAFNKPTFNGTPLTQVPNSLSAVNGKRYTEYWYLLNPPTITANVVVTLNGTADEILGTALSYSNVDQTTPFQQMTGFTAKGTTNCSGTGCKTAFSEIFVAPQNNKQLVLATITAQTPVPTFNTGSATIIMDKTQNNKLNSQTAQIAGSASTINLRWLYNYDNGVWAISSVIVNGASAKLNTLYWQVPSWGAACGGNNNRSFLVITPRSSNPSWQGFLNKSVREDLSFDLTSTFQAINFPQDEIYDWRIDTSIGSGLRTTGPTWSFIVKASCQSSGPSAPTLNTVNPVGSSANLSWNPPNSWGTNCSGNNNSYSLFLRRGDSNFTISDQKISNYTSTSYTVGLLESGYTYYWKVTANNGFASTDSTIGQFTTNRPPYFQTKAGGITSLGTIKSTLPAPTNAISLKSVVAAIDAGIISAKTSITPGSGNYSENGGGAAPSGWNRVSGTLSDPRIGELSYDRLFTNVMTNAGINSTNINNECANRGVLVPGTSITTFSPSSQFKIFCYGSILLSDSDLNTALSTIPDNTFGIFVPTSSGIRTFGAPNGTINTPAKKRAIIFANGHLTINSNITVSNTLGSEAGLVIAVNGNITTNDAVGQLDGVYIFSGTFNSNSSTATANQLTGNGSLIGTGTSAFNLIRTYGTTGATANPAELWTYQPKYLWLFRNILTQPSYSWKELPPQ